MVRIPGLLRRAAVMTALFCCCAGVSAPGAQLLPPARGEFPGVLNRHLFPPADPGAPDSTVAPPARHRPLLAFGEIVATNTLIWSYNRYIRENGTNPGFRIGFNSWEENFKNGFEWDDNSFATNQFAHPYHGNLYYNAARSNGYDFWTSVPFAFAGSFMWEHLYEIHHPSYNDWVATSIGGSALGEMLYRLSDLVLDNTATGKGRTWREFGGLLINPVRGFTRIVTGESARVGPNPAGRRPGYLGLRSDFGLRTVGESTLWEADTTRIFFDFMGQYGDPFHGDNEHPFDTFDFNFQLNFGDTPTLSVVRAHGLLHGTELTQESDSTRHLLGFTLNYDYSNNSAYSVGGTSLSAGITSRFARTFLGEAETRVLLGPIILAGVRSDYGSYTGRSYNYGPGMAAGLGGSLRRDGRPWLSFDHLQLWVHSLNGTDSDHHLSLTRLRFDQPLSTQVGLGAQYLLYLSENEYADFEDTSHRIPDARIFLSFPLD